MDLQALRKAGKFGSSAAQESLCSMHLVGFPTKVSLFQIGIHFRV
jgi:hypothetical protein